MLVVEVCVRGRSRVAFWCVGCVCVAQGYKAGWIMYMIWVLQGLGV